jgi:hypothetical protein
LSCLRYPNQAKRRPGNPNHQEKQQDPDRKQGSSVPPQKPAGVIFLPWHPGVGIAGTVEKGTPFGQGSLKLGFIAHDWSPVRRNWSHS